VLQVVWAHHARCFARQQMNYIMGSTGHSFVTDWGFNAPKKPHHRGASCGYVLLNEVCDQKTWYARDNQPFPNVLPGALVGGPNLYDEWKDSHLDFVASEVALDYNAALLSGALLFTIPPRYLCLPKRCAIQDIVVLNRTLSAPFIQTLCISGSEYHSSKRSC
jgi:hypothetical protein